MEEARNFLPDQRLITELQEVLRCIRELEALYKYEGTGASSRTEKTVAMIKRKSFNSTKDVQTFRSSLAGAAPSITIMITLMKLRLVREDTERDLAANKYGCKSQTCETER